MTRCDEAWNSPDERCERSLTSIELVEEQVPGKRNELARAVAEAVGRIVDELSPSEMEEVAAGKVTRFRSVIMNATESAVGAVEGTLKAKSLEGELKESQIVEHYAAVRERNANAEKADAEAAEIRQRTAFSAIRERLALYRDLGIEVKPVRLPDGRLAIAIGDGLAELLPSLDLSSSHGEPRTHFGSPEL